MSLSAFTFLDFLNAFTLISSILGISLSLLLLFSLPLTKKISLLINPLLNFKWKRILRFFDRHIETDSFFFRYPLSFGLLIILGSSYVLFYFLNQFDLYLFLSSLPHYPSISQNLELLVLLILIAGGILLILGIIFGLGMIFFPSSSRSINAKLSRWISLESPEEKPTTIQKDTDTICFLHYRLFGSTLLLVSLLLFILSLYNLHLCGFPF